MKRKIYNNYNRPKIQFEVSSIHLYNTDDENVCIYLSFFSKHNSTQTQTTEVTFAVFFP